MLFIKVKAEATSSAGAGTGNAGRTNRDAAQALLAMRNTQGGRGTATTATRNTAGGRTTGGIRRRQAGRRARGTSEQLELDI